MKTGFEHENTLYLGCQNIIAPPLQILLNALSLLVRKPKLIQTRQPSIRISRRKVGYVCTSWFSSASYAKLILYTIIYQINESYYMFYKSQISCWEMDVMHD